MRSSDPIEQQIDAFARYLGDERRSSSRTVETYVRDLRSFADYVRGEGLPADARELDIVAMRGFLSSLFRSNQASTMKKKVSAVRSFYKFLLKRQVIERNPAAGLRSPKVPKGLPRFLTVDQAFRVVEAPPKENSRAMSLRARDRALLEMLYGTGVRVGELASMNLGDCDFTERTVRVLGKGGKERVVPLGKSGFEALQAYLPERLGMIAKAKEPNGDALWFGRLKTSCVAMVPEARVAATFILTRCAIPVRRICSMPGRTFARSRNCSATPASRRHSDTRTSAWTASWRSMTGRTRWHGENRAGVDRRFGRLTFLRRS